MAWCPWQSHRRAAAPCERAERIINQTGHALRNILVVPALTLAIEGMHPRAIVHYGPKLVLLELAEIGDERHCHVLDALVMEGARKMMMIDHIVARFWTEHGRNHVLAKEFSALFGGDFTPELALGFDFAHSDGKLSRAKIGNCPGRQHWFA